jgi:hypothetical protein
VRLKLRKTAETIPAILRTIFEIDQIIPAIGESIKTIEKIISPIYFAASPI